MVYKYRPGKSREKTLRKHMIAKHGQVCMRCGYHGYVEMHHIIPVSMGGAQEEYNVLLLCEKCHMDEQGWKKVKYLDKARETWDGG